MHDPAHHPLRWSCSSICLLAFGLLAMPPDAHGQDSAAAAGPTVDGITVPLRYVPIHEPWGSALAARYQDNHEDNHEDILLYDGVPHHFMIRDKTLLIDRDGDGRISEADGPAIRPSQEFTLPLRVGGTIVPSNFLLLSIASHANQPSRLDILAPGCLEGEVFDHTVRIYDQAFHGRYGSDAGSTVTVGRPGSIQGANPQPMGSLLSIGQQWYTVSLAADHGSMQLQPFTGPVAPLSLSLAAGSAARLARASIQLQRVDEACAFTIDCPVVPGGTGQTTMTVPQGRYRIVNEELTYAPNGDQPIQGIYARPLYDVPGGGFTEAVVVVGTEGAQLIRGGPLRVWVDGYAEPGTDRLTLGEVHLIDATGGRYAIGYRPSTMRLIAPDGAIHDLGSISYGGNGLSGGEITLPDGFRDDGTRLEVGIADIGPGAMIGSTTLGDLRSGTAGPTTWSRVARRARAAHNDALAREAYGKGMRQHPDHVWLRIQSLCMEDDLQVAFQVAEAAWAANPARLARDSQTLLRLMSIAEASGHPERVRAYADIGMLRHPDAEFSSHASAAARPGDATIP